MDISFKQYLIEDANTRAVTKRIATAINTATNNKFDAAASTKSGSMGPVLAITTKDGKIPTEVYDVFKKLKVGVGDKTAEKQEDGSVMVKFFVMEL